MVLDFTKANKQQLLTILSEDCPHGYKRRAALELLSSKENEISRKVSQFKHKAAYSDKTYRFGG
ncbi:hypothetical protein [Neobacillus sp. 114]|uniref:hypothetical protein n=1 Tax=Neobacillus sp. 114 TaxID=3048535 RepID=UPI0024C282D9|nr:hypothetical protein [Neobacillus sp. 114]